MTTNTFEADDLIEQYADGPLLLREAIAGLSDTSLDTAFDEQGWTIRQIVHHIVDGDDLWKMCIKAAVGSQEPFSMKWYWDISQDRWAEMWRYAQREVEPSLRLLEANRERVVQLLHLIPEVLEREVIVKWPDAGEQQGTIGDVIRMQVAHLVGHVGEINKIKEVHNFKLG